MTEVPAPPVDALEKATAKRIQLAQCFTEVFGLSSKRNAAQKMVLAHLEACAGDDGNSYRFNEAKDGISLVAAGIHRDGAKSILRIIDRQLEIASRVREPKKEKPTTTR